LGRFGHSDTAQKAAGEDAGDFEAALFCCHTFGVGCRDHGKAPRGGFMHPPSLVTYAVRRRRAHFCRYWFYGCCDGVDEFSPASESVVGLAASPARPIPTSSNMPAARFFSSEQPELPWDF